MKLKPRSRNASMILADVGSSHPHASLPKFIAPRHKRVTFSPERPKPTTSGILPLLQIARGVEPRCSGREEEEPILFRAAPHVRRQESLRTSPLEIGDHRFRVHFND